MGIRLRVAGIVPMNHKVKLVGDITIIVFYESLVFDNLGAMNQVVAKRLGEPSTNKLLIDLSHIKWVDSSGMGFLVFMHKKLAARKGLFGLLSPTEEVMASFEELGLAKVLPIFKNEEEAVKAM